MTESMRDGMADAANAQLASRKEAEGVKGAPVPPFWTSIARTASRVVEKRSGAFRGAGSDGGVAATTGDAPLIEGGSAASRPAAEQEPTSAVTARIIATRPVRPTVTPR